jgi:hypothetical protein
MQYTRWILGNSFGFDMKTVIDKIEAVTRQAGFIYTFALILLRDLFFSPEDAADINWHEHLNFQELTFLAGLVVKAEIDLSIPKEADSAQIRLLARAPGPRRGPHRTYLGLLALPRSFFSGMSITKRFPSVLWSFP